MRDEADYFGLVEMVEKLDEEMRERKSRNDHHELNHPILQFGAIVKDCMGAMAAVRRVS